MATPSDIYIAWMDKSLIHAMPWRLNVAPGDAEREIIKASTYMGMEGMQGLPQVFPGGIPSARAVEMCKKSMAGRRRMGGQEK